MSDLILISIVIPAFNEEKTLSRHLDRLLQLLAEHQVTDREIIVVDDGSTDNTADTVRRYGDSVTLLSYGTNVGKGYAVSRGVLASRGEEVLICDADMSTPPETLFIFLDIMKSDPDIVIGNRRDPRSRILKKQSIVRRLLGAGFILLARSATSTLFHDYNCGFKLFKGNIARELFGDCITTGWSYDIEMIGRAMRRGYVVTEVPVEWSSGDNSCVRVLRDVYSSFREIVSIRKMLKNEPEPR